MSKTDSREDLARWQQEAAFRGWTPDDDAAPCPRDVMPGLRCLQREDLDARCWCTQLRHYGHARVLDHCRRWIDRQGRPVLTSEPYDFDRDDIAELADWCNERGIELTVGAVSPYYPGETTLLIFVGGGRP